MLIRKSILLHFGILTFLGISDDKYTSVHHISAIATNHFDLGLLGHRGENLADILADLVNTMLLGLDRDFDFAHERNILITIETEGSHFLATDYPIDLISLSPKFKDIYPLEA